MDGLDDARLSFLLGYCKLTELKDDPEVQAVLPVLFRGAADYLSKAGVSEPPEDTPRRATYDLLCGYLVLDAWERRDATISASGAAVAENPSFRQMLVQMKLTEE